MRALFDRPSPSFLVSISRTWLVLLICLAATTVARAQSPDGDWEGTFKTGALEFRLVLHITRDDKGGLKATIDSPDQNVAGIPVGVFTFTEPELKFELPAIQATYSGKLKADRSGITGTWTQAGTDVPLDFTRSAPKAEVKPRTPRPSAIDGSWDGVLEAGGQSLKVALHIITYDDGMSAKLDSPDQNLTGVPISSIKREGSKVSLTMKQFGATYEGTLDADLKTLTGDWSQGGGNFPLVFKRSGTAAGEKKP